MANSKEISIYVKSICSVRTSVPCTISKLAYGSPDSLRAVRWTCWCLRMLASWPSKQCMSWVCPQIVCRMPVFTACSTGPNHKKSAPKGFLSFQETFHLAHTRFTPSPICTPIQVAVCPPGITCVILRGWGRKMPGSNAPRVVNFLLL